MADEDSDDSPSSEGSSRWKDSGAAKKLGAAGKSLSKSGQKETDRSAALTSSIQPVAYRKGGKVRKTGPAIVHRNERVIPASKRKKAEKVMRKAGMSLTNKKRGKKRKAGRSGGRS